MPLSTIKNSFLKFLHKKKSLPETAVAGPTVQPAYAALMSGDLQTAESICQDILRSNPDHVDANNCLGVTNQRMGRPERAIVFFESTLRIAPGFVPAYGNLANSLAQLGRMDEARAVLDRALSLQPPTLVENRMLGDLGYQTGQYQRAVPFYKKALTICPGDIASRVGLGMTYRRLGNLVESLACYDEALRSQPDNASIHVDRGNVLSDIGRIEDAAESYRQAIRSKPDHARAYQLLAGVKTFSRHDAEIDKMEALYRLPNTSLQDRMSLAFGLGKAFEDLLEYDRAFGFFSEANKLRRRMAAYSIASDTEFFQRIKANFDAGFFKNHLNLGSQDKTPIFIFGMPRSGTSLVEQIISSHPQVYGAGELADIELISKSSVTNFPDGVETVKPDAWQEMAEQYLGRLREQGGSAKFVTDKMPQNFLYLAMIAVMFPNARLIHCTRDPLDTCLSLYKNMFGISGHEWSYDLTDLGQYYRLYLDLMAHWQSFLPSSIYAVKYEHLVEDPERETRALLEHIGLNFDPACVDFHKSKRVVRTLSFAQIRRPIYKDSVQRWKRYERHLGPLLEAMAKS